MPTGKRKRPVEHGADQDNTLFSALELVERCAERRGIFEFEFRQKSGQLCFLDGRKFKWEPRGDNLPILDVDSSKRWLLAFSRRGIHAVIPTLSRLVV